MGTAKAIDWTLTATPNPAIPGQAPISGAGGTARTAVAPGQYTLTESTGPSGYAPSSWVCPGATVTAGGVVTVATGADVTCTITNDDQAAHLTLVKSVTNDNGGTAKAIDWTLTATPNPAIPGQAPISGAGGTARTAVAPGQYTLTESTGPSGYAPSSWVCPGATVTAGGVVTVATGADVTCTITNDDQAAHLTLVKSVTNDNGGTAKATDWTLTATPNPAIPGQAPISGAGGTARTAVAPGQYTLTESTGPSGYAPSSWVCPGATVTAGGVVTVATGADVTCTITNDDQAAHLTLVKTVTNDNGGTAKATDWTLTATPNPAIPGQAPISGAGGTAGPRSRPASTPSPSPTGPSGYAPSSWVCPGATETAGGIVTVTTGDDVTCTITNDDQPATLTLVKVVDNGETGATTDRRGVDPHRRRTDARHLRRHRRPRGHPRSRRRR